MKLFLEVAAVKLEFVGVKVTEISRIPRTVGSNAQVALAVPA